MNDHVMLKFVCAFLGLLTEANWLRGVKALLPLLHGAIVRFRAAAKSIFA